MIRINLHGKLGEDIGESWDLEVSSVAEAFRAIESNTRKFRRWILKYANEYEVELNNSLCTTPVFIFISPVSAE